jgi:broad specificity phosphatase PhoE
MPTALLIRHAQASFGAADYDVLSELGHRQVDALVAAFERRGIGADRVVSGSARRHHDTARHWVAATGDGTRVDPRWDEYDDADVLTHYSTTTARVERSPDDPSPAMSSREFQVLLDEALRGWVADGADTPSPYTFPAFLERVEDAFADLTAGLGSGETALAFTSSGVVAALTASLIGQPTAFVALNRVTVNTGVTKVVLGRQGTTLVSFNDHSHLEEAGSGLVTYR